MARIPTDKTLPQWIRELEACGELWRFYKTDEWLELRDDVMNDQHKECYECLKRGKVKRAVMVHHVNEVRQRPELALSKYYTDENGDKQLQLVALCFKCHEVEHKRLEKWNADRAKEKFTNTERW